MNLHLVARFPPSERRVGIADGRLSPSAHHVGPAADAGIERRGPPTVDGATARKTARAASGRSGGAAAAGATTSATAAYEAAR